MDTAEFFNEKLQVVAAPVYSQLPRQSKERGTHLFTLAIQNYRAEEWAPLLVLVRGNLGKDLAKLRSVNVQGRIEIGHLGNFGIRRTVAAFRHLL